MSLKAVVRKDAYFIYDEVLVKEKEGEFSTGICVWTVPPEYSDMVGLFILLHGHLDFGNQHIILCSRQEFEEFLITIETGDENKLLELGIKSIIERMEK